MKIFKFLFGKDKWRRLVRYIIAIINLNLYFPKVYLRNYSDH